MLEATHSTNARFIGFATNCNAHDAAVMIWRKRDPAFPQHLIEINQQKIPFTLA
jgi:hypothetical protein